MKKKIKKIVNYHRHKIACIHHRDILHLFNKQVRDFFYIFHFDKIPDDVKIINVWYDNPRMSFLYLLEHKTFKRVKEGEIPEIIYPNIYEIQLNIKDKK